MLTLQRSGLYVEIAPEIGGSLACFQAHGVDVLRRSTPEMLAARDPLQMACFPMTPFANRIANGCFDVGKEHIALPTPQGSHPLHGYGWRSPWDVTTATDEAVELCWRGSGETWPWPCKSVQRIELTETALVISLSVENCGQVPMPASLGLHPYFPGIEDARLDAHYEGMWETDSTLIPTHWIKSPSAQGLPLRGSDLDNCFTGVSWPAWISWPSRPFRVGLSGTECRFMQVYTRGVDGSFCVEAQTAMPDAVNRATTVPGGTGLVILGPGERLGCITRFEVQPTASAALQHRRSRQSLPHG